MQMRNIEKGSANGYLTDTTCGRSSLKGMGPPAAGFDAGSELPTDPTALVARQ